MYSAVAMNKLCFFRRTVVYVHFIGSLLQCHTTSNITNKSLNKMAVARPNVANVATPTTTNTDPSTQSSVHKGYPLSYTNAHQHQIRRHWLMNAPLPLSGVPQCLSQPSKIDLFALLFSSAVGVRLLCHLGIILVPGARLYVRAQWEGHNKGMWIRSMDISTADTTAGPGVS